METGHFDWKSFQYRESFWYKLKQWNFTKSLITSKTVCIWTRKTFWVNIFHSLSQVYGIIYWYIHSRVQRKSFLQLAIWASWSQHSLAQTSFQLTPKTFWLEELISQFFCYSNSSNNIRLKTEFTSPIAKSNSPRLSDTTFFARCKDLNYSTIE